MRLEKSALTVRMMVNVSIFKLVRGNEDNLTEAVGTWLDFKKWDGWVYEKK